MPGGIGISIGESTMKPKGATGAFGSVQDSADIGRIELSQESVEVEFILSDPVFIPPPINNGGVVQGRQRAGIIEDLNTESAFLEDVSSNSGFQRSEPILLTDVVPAENWSPPITSTPLPGGSLPTTRIVSCELPTGIELQPGTQPQEWSKPEKHYYDPFSPMPTRVPANFPSIPKVYDVPIPVEPPVQSKNTPFVAAPNSPMVKGSLFFDPLEGCDACCHTPNDSPTQFFTICLLACTDPAITQMVENGMIEQVYSSIPALQEKFENGQPGAHLRETSFTELTSKQVASLADSNLFETPASMISSRNGSGMPGIVNKTTTQSYQFQRKMKFKIPPNCQHLTLFIFIRLDDVAFREFYKMPTSSVPQKVYTGAIKEVSVITDSNLQTASTGYLDAGNLQQFRGAVQRTSGGEYYTFEPGRRTKARRLIKTSMPVGNIRSSQVLDNLIGVCSTSINEAIQF